MKKNKPIHALGKSDKAIVVKKQMNKKLSKNRGIEALRSLWSEGFWLREIRNNLP
ncbi:hypothetical protein GWN75_25820 [candidate division KSB1 bacterium]|nr:hypothetical protein [candidate division KSB1 bacterium]NIS27124.1 hypothetical protein [candidate division KSB1 bacterium]NIU27869.1 hypothetical protein [candidate division KSB1 bacterium]NIV69141.1 hypothetical protein [Phycisphaerae bacterium]NIW21810.1 hypothetical protein [candidate division KSB1 bacterium]